MQHFGAVSMCCILELYRYTALWRYVGIQHFGAVSVCCILEPFRYTLWWNCFGMPNTRPDSLHAYHLQNMFYKNIF